MIWYDRRTNNSNEEPRAFPDRRAQLRRRSDLRTIVHYAWRIDAGEKRVEVIVDGGEGLRLVAMFECACVAVEPIGAGRKTVRIEPCRTHGEPRIERDRRRRNGSRSR